MLERLGLDADTETVYRALLRAPRRTEQQLVTETRLAPQHVRDCVSRLTELRLVRTSWQDPDRLLPISPEIGLQALVAEQEDEVLSRQRELARSRAAAQELMAEYSALYSDQKSVELERLTGVDEVRSRIEELAASAEVEIAAFCMGAQREEALAASRPVDERAIRRGVALRGMYLDSVNNHPATRRYAQWVTTAGGEIRTLPTLPLRMVIFDRRFAVLPVDPEETAAGAVVLSGRGTLTALTTLFEQTWAMGSPFGCAREPADAGVSDSERALLRLLGEGVTDEVAARTMGVSLRTARRMMSDLMARLDARSRFQAGVRARARNWL